jgi:dTDP-4-dehydrorhamnose 3,5-epimerase
MRKHKMTIRSARRAQQRQSPSNSLRAVACVALLCAVTDLSVDSHYQFWWPASFANGFVVLSEKANFLYRTTGYHALQHERRIAWNAPVIGIRWPAGLNPQLSVKDQMGFTLKDTELFA